MAQIAIPYSRQVVDRDDIDAVARVLASDYITQGPKVIEFEEAIADYCNARYAVSFTNGTAALHAACQAADLGPGDEGIVSPISFVATANCLLYVGATARFADVEPGLPLLSPSAMRSQITDKTRVIIPVHFAGTTAAMADFQDIARENDLLIIEDACHALGSRYRLPGHDGWIRVGSCEHSDMTVFSFHPVKNITTGEGGMVTTNDTALYRKLRALRHHGLIKPFDRTHNVDEYPEWYYEMQSLGYNFRLTDIQAALGLSQLKKIDRFQQARKSCVDQYEKSFKETKLITLLKPQDNCHSAYHLCPIILEPELNRDDLFASLRSQGIGCQLHYIPIYRHPYYQERWSLNPEEFPRAEAYYSSSLSIPCYPSLSMSDQEQVIDSILTWCGKQGLHS